MTYVRKHKHAIDPTFGLWHRNYLTDLWRALGHRLLFADRDWTEVCNFCRQPIALIEEVLDVGQNLDEKSVRWTQKLGLAARVPAYLVAPRLKRSQERAKRIKKLEAELRDLYCEDDIEQFTVKNLIPHGPLHEYSVEDYALFTAALHRMHHASCLQATAAIKKGRELPIDQKKLLQFVHGDQVLTTKDQLNIFFASPDALKDDDD